MARVVVDVMLKPEILDPQGRAVQGALARLGLTGVSDVRQGKRFEITLDGDLDPERETLLAKLSEELLANPVIEDFTLRVEADVR
ncbi:MAG: phosphoribosylformylglycinamidine synthase subunit PurS [Candidatus Nanopelagicales bacterium]